MIADAAEVVAAADGAGIFFVGVDAGTGAEAMTPQYGGRLPTVYLIAAEESGDALGAALARALDRREGGIDSPASAVAPWRLPELSARSRSTNFRSSA